MKKFNKKGFTIVELVIVIAVIAILAAVMIPTFSGIVDKAKASAALQEVKAAYTVYLSDALVDDDASTPAAKITVAHEGVTVNITNGEAKVEDNALTGNDVVSLVVVDHTNGTDKTLGTAPAQGS